MATFLEDSRGWATLQVQTHLLSQKPVMRSSEEGQVLGWAMHTNFKQIRLSSLLVLRTPCIQLGCKTWLLGSALKVILLAGR